MIEDLDGCLPPTLRGPATRIARVSAGFSGAGVYRVDAGTESFALKVAPDTEPVVDWRSKLRIQQLAADAGLAPRIVHVDETRRAVLSEFVTDRSFAALYGDPRTREAAITQLGKTIRRVHELPLTVDADEKEARDFLIRVWSGLAGSFPMPAFVGDAVARVLGERPPESDRALVLSHNDVNPTNLVHDGETLLLLDWEMAGANDPFFDLAAIAVFMRMDADSCRTLLGAYESDVVSTLPTRFDYNRRLMAVLVGVNFLQVARQSGHRGATGAETLEATSSLGEFYQRLRTGALAVSTAEGQWQFGLSMAKESLALRGDTPDR